MRLFSIDGPIYKFMTSLTAVFLLSMCFWISCLPIVTIGAGIVAACDLAMKMADNQEGYIIRQFFKSLKNNFKQGFILGIITLIGAYAAFLDFRIFEAVESNPIIFPIVGIATISILIIGAIYSYPQVARYENHLHIIIRNSFRIFTKFLFRTIGIIFLMAVLLAAFLFNYTTIFMGFLIGPGCIFYVWGAGVKKLFKIIEKDDKAEKLTEEQKDYISKETVLTNEQYKFANAIDESDIEEKDSEENEIENDTAMEESKENAAGSTKKEETAEDCIETDE